MRRPVAMRDPAVSLSSLPPRRSPPAQPFDRRQVDRPRIIAKLLSMQKRALTAIEAALELNAAADRIAAFAQACDAPVRGRGAPRLALVAASQEPREGAS